MRKDFTSKAFLFTFIVVVMTLAISKLFVFKIGNIATKQTSILSDIIPIGNMDKQLTQRLLADTNMLMYEQDFVNIKVDKELPSDILTTKWVIETTASPQNQSHSEPKPFGTETENAVNIEDYSPDSSAMSRFYDALAGVTKNRNKAVKIAVLGDSFIESDILTADLREMLQERYGGRGVGFIPFSDAFTNYRATVKHTSSGWDTYNIVKNSDGATPPKGAYYVSGMVCVPQEGAVTRIKGAGTRKNTERFSESKLLFVNKERSRLTVCINDTLARVFTPEPSANVQQIVIKGDIKSIDLKVNNVAGFIGYGVVLDDDSGVRVDNYAVRGNSGLALSRTDFSVNSQIGKILDYDLIVLQYGLNAMQAELADYKAYAQRMERIVEYIKRCFPGSSILVMSVGDRSFKDNGRLTTTAAVQGMIEAQRRFARDTQVAFWNTYEAMGGENSMIEFVDKNWASKDYTHITLKGGKYIATQLINSIDKEHRQQRQTAIVKKDVKFEGPLHKQKMTTTTQN